MRSSGKFQCSNPAEGSRRKHACGTLRRVAPNRCAQKNSHTTIDIFPSLMLSVRRQRRVAREIAGTMPELPEAKRRRFVRDFRHHSV